VGELRRGREKYRADERILGSSSFIEEIMNEAEKQEERKSKKVSLDTLINRVLNDMGIDRERISAGEKNRRITKARALLAYIWIRHLGRSGYELAKVLGVSPQSLYAASGRIEIRKEFNLKDIEQWRG
jgi:chromosomal replication initiation ATPase DnaA